MGPSQELIDSIYRERVLRARSKPIDQKFLAGAELFDEVCQRIAGGLKSENPGADETTVDRLLRQRLDFLRRLRATDDR